jgi:hypothetical protein
LLGHLGDIEAIKFEASSLAARVMTANAVLLDDVTGVGRAAVAGWVAGAFAAGADVVGAAGDDGAGR